MRLLFVSHSFPPENRPLANIGGMQRVAMDLYEALSEHETVTLSPLILRCSWRWTHVRTGPFMLKALWKIRRMVERGEVDAVLFSSMVTASLAVLLRDTLRQHGVCAAAIVHGRDVTLDARLYQHFVPHVFSSLDAVLPVSRATGEECLARGLAREKLHVVPNGIHIDRFATASAVHADRGALVEALGTPDAPLPDDALLLCSVGRQVKRKGFAWFTEHVMPHLPENVHYWLAGEGPEAEHIQDAARRCGLESRVRLLGRVSDDHLERLYRGADLFIMPNIPVPGDMEGFGVVMLEAGLCGLPAVAARLEGIRDVISEGKNGHLVESGDVQGFQEAILRYDTSPADRRAARERAHTYVADTFSWQTVADQYVQTLKGLIGQPA